jgi:hypothetical protein
MEWVAGIELAAGAVVLVVAVAALWLALPRDGQVRGFLRNDQVQAYYAVAILVAFVVGLIGVARGLISAVT